MNNIVIPFGKYAGRLCNLVAQSDPDYANWLLDQEWFWDKYEELALCLESWMEKYYGV